MVQESKGGILKRKDMNRALCPMHVMYGATQGSKRVKNYPFKKIQGIQ